MKNRHEKTEKAVFKLVRQAFIASQVPGTFRSGAVKFDRIQEDPRALNAERHLAYLGIELNDEGRAKCWCGSIYAKWKPETRRFTCPKSRGCGLDSLDLVRLTETWVRRGSPKPDLTDLSIHTEDSEGSEDSSSSPSSSSSTSKPGTSYDSLKEGLDD